MLEFFYLPSQWFVCSAAIAMATAYRNISTLLCSWGTAGSVSVSSTEFTCKTRLRNRINTWIFKPD